MTCDSQNIDLYAVLGVERGAKPDDIRRAYKRLAMEFHPDKNPGGADRFKDICDAYRILNDPEQRAVYDSGPKRRSLRDLQAELSRELHGRDLHDWVSDLVRTERDAQAQREAFERRRQEEMRRRAEFDAMHGGAVSTQPPLHASADVGWAPRRLRSEGPPTSTSPLHCDPLASAPTPKPHSAGATDRYSNYSSRSSPDEVGYDVGLFSAQPDTNHLKQQFLQDYRRRKAEGNPNPKPGDPAPRWLADPTLAPAGNATRPWKSSSASISPDLTQISDAVLADALKGYPRFTGAPVRTSGELD